MKKSLNIQNLNKFDELLDNNVYFEDPFNKVYGIENFKRIFLKKLKMNGHELLPIEMPHTEYCISTYYILTTAEASSNLARYDGVQYGIRNKTGNHIDMVQNTRNIGFGDEVKRRILLGTFVLSSGYYDAYFEKAQKMRRGGIKRK